MKLSNAIKLTIVMLIWASSWIFIKFSLGYVKPFSLAFLRFFLASILLFPIAMLRKKGEMQKFSLSDLKIYCILALTGVTLLYVFEFIALLYTTAINASLLINLSVIFVALFTFFFWGERLERSALAGIVISLVGVFLIVTKGKPFEFFTEKSFIGDLLIISSAFLWMVYTIVGKKFLERKDPLVATAYTFALGTIFLIPFAFYDNLASIFEIPFITWLAILYLAIFCSVIGYFIWAQVIKEELASKVSVFLYMVPLFTAVFSVIFLNEEITIFIILGGFLVIFGVHLAEK
ncbi:MAG: DMT family transporter [Candidatus Altiarchaeota archaeon]